MKSLGLDISTYVGMAIVGEEDRGKVVHLDRARGYQRLQMLRQEVERTISIWQPDVALVEGYAFGAAGRSSSIVTLVECGTVVRNALFMMKIPWFEVPPTTLKLWTFGKGSAKKPQMKAAVLSRWGYTSPSDDIVDAYALARMGQIPKEDLLELKGVHPGG